MSIYPRSQTSSIIFFGQVAICPSNVCGENQPLCLPSPRPRSTTFSSIRTGCLLCRTRRDDLARRQLLPESHCEDHRVTNPHPSPKCGCTSPSSMPQIRILLGVCRSSLLLAKGRATRRVANCLKSNGFGVVVKITLKRYVALAISPVLPCARPLIFSNSATIILQNV